MCLVSRLFGLKHLLFQLLQGLLGLEPASPLKAFETADLWTRTLETSTAFLLDDLEHLW